MLLTRHKQLSELHRRNQLRQDEEIQQKKEELRQAIASVRKQLQEVDHAMSKQAQPDQDLQSQRLGLDRKMQQAAQEYGAVQER